MIRTAKKEDIKKITDIENQWPDYPKWGEVGFLKEFEKDYSKIFVYDDGGVKGFINIWDFKEEMEINTLVVSKSNIGHGIGFKLMEYALSYAKNNGVKRILLEVNEKNEPAISLYKKFGFEVYNLRKKYYDLKYDALLMRKEIV